MKKICQKEPKLNRPKIQNPCKSSEVQAILDIITPEPEQFDPRQKEQEDLMEEIETLMCFDPKIQYAKKLGFDEDHIRRVISQNMQQKKTFCNDRDEFIKMLFKFNKKISLAEKIKRLELQQYCNVCQQNEKNCLCLPCGHQSLCWQCAQSLKFCWTCKTKIKEKIRSYRV